MIYKWCSTSMFFLYASFCSRVDDFAEKLCCFLKKIPVLILPEGLCHRSITIIFNITWYKLIDIFYWYWWIDICIYIYIDHIWYRITNQIVWSIDLWLHAALTPRQAWIDNGIPVTFWLSGIYFTQDRSDQQGLNNERSPVLSKKVMEWDVQYTYNK